MMINANFRLFAATHFDASKYVESPAYGVNRFMLDRIGEEKARATTIVEYSPNSKFPQHTHIGGEEFLVLEGRFLDEYGVFPAGTYVRNPVDSKHSPWVEEDGCTIMVKLLQMAETPSELKEPLYIDLEKEKASRGKHVDFGTRIDLYMNTFTGEHVEMYWILPGKIFPADEKIKKGEELFVVDGSLQHDGTEYTTWGWLRFPPSDGNDTSNRSQLKAGAAGCQVYRKTGHLTDEALSKEKIQIKEH